MGKLHEILAVDTSMRGTCKKIVAETGNTFSTKRDHFEETMKVYEPLAADDPEKLDSESKPMVTTVVDKLSYFEGHMVKLLDVILQKESTNAIAKADVIIKGDDDDNGIVLGNNVPVSALVQFENILEDLRTTVYDVIPTLDPQKHWEKDPNRNNVYVADKVTRLRCRKQARPVTLAAATDKHAAQVQLVNEDVPAGNWVYTFASGAFSPAEKSDLLARVDSLLFAVKAARSRANDAEVTKINIGKRMFQYLNSGN